MYTVSAAYKQALANSEPQHIKGTITLTDGSTISIPDGADISKPSIRLQCTSASDVFMIGQLYTGTLDFTLISDTIRREKLRGGTVTLSVGVGTLDEWVPMGVWNITDPQRGNQNEILVKCVDNTSKLDVAINDDTVGIIKLESRLKKIRELTGLHYEGEGSQGELTDVISNLSTIADKNMASNSVYGATFCSTCRAELLALAQYIGGCVYINREGKIAFRAYGDNTAPVIQASRRFKVNLAEYSTQVGSIAYTYRKGSKDITIETDEGGTANTLLRLVLSENPYIWQANDDDKLEELDRILLNLASAGTWLPGEFDYYGDPTIDLGDKLILAGGVIPESQSLTQRYFIVTGICWQFRGPQTLISAGAGTTTGSTNYSSSSSSSGSGSGIIIQQPIVGAADLDFYRSEFTTLTEIGEVMIATSEDTIGIVQITVQVKGTADAENEFRILRDGIMQTTYSCDSIADNERRTITLTAVLDFTAGIHIISVEAKGSATILRAIGTVYGQGIQEYTGNPTFDSDYTAPSGVINRYLGSDIMPRIPSQISGSNVYAIDGGAFLHSEIKYANIPDGTEEVL